MAPSDSLRAHLLQGQVIPAHPLALNANRKLDERRQRALTRYYIDAGAGGLAVAVHTTQFEIREPAIGLLAPVLELASGTADDMLRAAPRAFVKVAGICGSTGQAVQEARLAVDRGYDAGLLSLAALPHATDAELVSHCRAVAEVIPLFAFYLQPAVGGRHLGGHFWRDVAEIPSLLAVKIAPFDRYATGEVIRAIDAAGRDDVALYTGNDDHILLDLMTPFPASTPLRPPRRIVGGVLGQWAVWTKRAVELLAELHDSVPARERLAQAAAITDANGALFDAPNRFQGSIPGIHEVLRRQRLLEGTWCLDPGLALSPGQREEIDRVIAAYPWLTDDAFVAEHLDRWLS